MEIPNIIDGFAGAGELPRHVSRILSLLLPNVFPWIRIDDSALLTVASGTPLHRTGGRKVRPWFPTAARDDDVVSAHGSICFFPWGGGIGAERKPSAFARGFLRVPLSRANPAPRDTHEDPMAVYCWLILCFAAFVILFS